MRTIDYLKELDYGQLVFARDQAEKMINYKNKENRRTVWQVNDGCAVYGNFPENDYLKAAEKLLCEAKLIVAKKTNRLNLRVEKISVRESEYEDYIRIA